MALGQPEERSALCLREEPRGADRVRAGDVDVEDRSAEKLVPDRPADDVRLVAGDRRPDAGSASRMALGALGRRSDSGRDLVVDRAENAGMLLRQDAVADQGDRRPLGLVVELDREGIHGDRADDAAARPADQDLRPGEAAPEAVGVPDGNEADPRRTLGDEAAAVAGALVRAASVFVCAT